MKMSQHVEHYIAIKRSLGYKYEDQEQMLMNFALFAEGQGDRFAQTDRMIEWASKAPSVHRSREWLRTVRALAVSLHAEDDRHEIPPRTVFGSGRRPRPTPHLITVSQIERLMEAARSLPPVASITPYTFRCMIGLIATTGLRVSEAVALRLTDLTRDGLVIRETKFRKSRLLPIHRSTRKALKEYLSLRARIGGPDRHLFVLSTGEAPDTATVARAFLKVARQTGLRGAPGQRGPRLHDLRHNFAVRSLEQCGNDRNAVRRHMLALSTYLGHACISDTYWYLEATPALLRKVAQATERAQMGRDSR